MFQYFLWLALILQYVANIPLIYKIIKTKSAKDLSLASCIIWAYVTFTMLIYAWMVKDIYFMLGQLGQTLINLIILILVLKWSK